MAFRMGTPEDKSVESVREKRAMFSIRIRGPNTGTFKVKLSHLGLPCSEIRQRLKKMPPPMPPRKRSGQKVTTNSLVPIRIWVIRGSSAPRSANISEI